MQTKDYFKALKSMPDKFVHEDTDFITTEDSMYMANPLYAPYRYRDGVWQEMVVEEMAPK